jgi:CNT family concentrative nucleoside transporter
LQPLLGTSGAETLCAVANSFLGQTESPLLIRHYIKDMTKSEIMLVMISGMGTISGSILVVYAAIGVPIQYLLSASVMAIPATIMISKILYPETEHPKTMRGAQVEIEASTSNALEAISSGTSDGLQLALNVGAMLIAFVALIGLINSILSFVCITLSLPVVSLQSLFGIIFSPFGWLLGLSGTEITAAGELIGIKVSVNEMLAFTQMVGMGLSQRAIALLTYALCGFANFSCIGIQIGGIGALAPSKRAVLSELGFRAVLGGTLANLLSAMVAGLLL